MRISYNSDGLRIKKVENGITTYYAYDGDKCIYEESYSGATQQENIIHYYLQGKNIADDSSIDGRTYNILDHLGSRDAVVNVSGVIIDNPQYSAFGEREGGSVKNYKDTDKQLDESTGLTYINHRNYNSSLGRFITEDPAKDGQNWYVYCNNNPLKYVDPTGMFPTLSDYWGFVFSQPSMGPINAAAGNPVAQEAMQAAAVQVGKDSLVVAEKTATAAVSVGGIAGAGEFVFSAEVVTNIAGGAGIISRAGDNGLSNTMGSLGIFIGLNLVGGLAGEALDGCKFFEKDFNYFMRGFTDAKVGAFSKQTHAAAQKSASTFSISAITSIFNGVSLYDFFSNLFGGNDEGDDD